jgi:5-methylcytosine-specific restriction enzyme A
VPSTPLRPCGHPGCGKLVKQGRCELHRKQECKEVDVRRGSAHERGYTAQWAKYSKARLRQYPLCMECGRQGRITPATCTDHIIAHKGNMTLFWATDNHQSLCKRCNDRKAVTEGRWGSRLRVATLSGLIGFVVSSAWSLSF